MKKIETLVWASDFSISRGEGILANSFFKEFIKFNKNEKITIKTLEQKIFFKKKNFKNLKVVESNNFFHKYTGPSYGAFDLLLNYKKKILYLNYLPLWNFLIFFLLPSKVILGPITGGAVPLKVSNFNTLLRKYILPLCYIFSLIIINLKFKRVIFSTNLLKKYVCNKKKKKYLFSYIYLNFINHINKKKNNKKFDLIFYNRKHLTKKNDLIKKIVFKLPSQLKICVIGENILKDNIINYGFVDRKKAVQLIRNSKLAFASSENILSLFVIDAYNSKTGILFDNNKMNSRIIISKKNFLPMNFNNLDLAVKQIEKYILTYKFVDDKNFQDFLLKKKNKIKIYLNRYFLNLE
jgi:hypothetical protein